MAIELEENLTTMSKEVANPGGWIGRKHVG